MGQERTRVHRKKWKQFEKNLSDQVSVARPVTAFQEAIDAIDLHAFGDTSGTGTAATVYAVVHQASGLNQRLLASNQSTSREEGANVNYPKARTGLSAHGGKPCRKNEERPSKTAREIGLWMA